MYSFEVNLSQLFLYNGLLVEIMFKVKPGIDALFEWARQLVSLEGPIEPPHESSFKRFLATGKFLSRENVSKPLSS